MSSSRWVICFTLLALCLAPFTGLERAQAVRGTNDDPQWTMTNAMPGSENTDTPVQAIPCALEKMPTTIVSLASDGTPGDDNSNDPSISADGRFVAFTSLATNLVDGDTNLLHDVFVHDLQTGETRRASLAMDGAQGNNDSVDPYISADGRLVAFHSAASNLVYSDTNGAADIFVQD